MSNKNEKKEMVKSKFYDHTLTCYKITHQLVIKPINLENNIALEQILNHCRPKI